MWTNFRVADDPLGAIAERYGVCDVGVVLHKGKSSNDSIMEINRRRAKRSWTPAHGGAADANTDDFMTVLRPLPGRREAGPTARTARQTN